VIGEAYSLLETHLLKGLSFGSWRIPKIDIKPFAYSAIKGRMCLVFWVMVIEDSHSTTVRFCHAKLRRAVKGVSFFLFRKKKELVFLRWVKNKILFKKD